MGAVPLVSICLPNFRNRPYLPERLQTIFAQTFPDWELVVVDSHSDDGAWEFLVEAAKAEPRMRLWRAPRGLFASWNRCVQLARGRYIYFAPSDDTMAPNCLELLVAALETNPDSDLAHCPLRVVDEHGAEKPDWWRQHGVFVASATQWVDRPHRRRAPFDAMFHLLGETVFISMTQLLIRRSLFERIGWFEERWGSVSDFHWHLRAAFATDAMHVPGTWGGWRMYEGQATAEARIGSPAHRQQIQEMLEDAIERSTSHIPPRLLDRLRGGWSIYFERRRQLRDGIFARRGRPLAQTGFVLRELLRPSSAAWSYFGQRLRGVQPLEREWSVRKVHAWLREAGYAYAELLVESESPTTSGAVAASSVRST